MLSCLQRELIKLRMLVTNLQESVARSATANHEEVRYPLHKGLRVSMEVESLHFVMEGILATII